MLLLPQACSCFIYIYALAAGTPSAHEAICGHLSRHAEPVFKHASALCLMLLEFRLESKKQKHITDYFKQ